MPVISLKFDWHKGPIDMFTADQMQAALSFVQSQASHIEPGVYARKFPQIQYSFLIPVDTSAHPFAKTVTYYSSDQFGKAKWINGNSNDVPVAGSERAQHETDVQTAAIGYGYGFEELGQATMLNQPLTAEKAMAARRAYEEMVEGVALQGDASKGYQGLFNNSDVGIEVPTNGDWSTATPDQILADFNQLITSVGTNTNFVSMANTVLLPDEKMDVIGTRRIEGTDTTIIKFLRENNSYTARTGQPLTIRSSRGLKTAGAGGTNRAVAYRRDPEVLKLHVPMPHRFLPAQPDGLNVIVPGVFRLGGLDIRLTKEVRYMDGI